MTKETVKTEWDLTPLLASDADPKIESMLKEYKDNYYVFINKWKDRDNYLKDPAVLKEALDEWEKLSTEHGITGKVGYYFNLRARLDSENIKVKEMKAKLNDFKVKISNDRKFLSIRLSKVDEETQKIFLNSKELVSYKHYLEKLFRKAKHILSEKEEKVISLLAKSAYGDWSRMVSDFISSAELEVTDEKGKKTKKTLGEAITLAANHKDKDVRASGTKAIKNLLENNVRVSEREINAILYTKKAIDELRGYEEPNFSRLRGDDIEPEVVSAMAGVVTNNFEISRDYYKFKADLFGMDKLKYFDRGLKYGEVDKEYTFKEATQLIEEAFRDMDAEFGSFVRQYVENGRFDVFPKKGKRSGAFCIHYNKNLPVYILLNHTNKLNDVTTIAHELGHAINNELMLRSQNSFNGNATIATAEVSSNFFESLIQERLMKNLTDSEKLSLLIEDVDNDVSAIIRQTACYNFELTLHDRFKEKGFLSKESIGEIFVKHMSGYMGDYVDQSELGHLYWVSWPHIRRFFYVYSYSSGSLIAKALKEKYDKNNEFVNEIKTFLSTGTSKSPKDIFFEMGIDITKEEFWSEGLVDLKEKIEKARKLATSLGEFASKKD